MTYRKQYSSASPSVCRMSGGERCVGVSKLEVFRASDRCQGVTAGYQRSSLVETREKAVQGSVTLTAGAAELGRGAAHV
jgi:hypothetical protein